MPATPALWYAQYVTTDNNKVTGAGFLVNPQDFVIPGENKDVTPGFEGEIPNDLFNSADHTPAYRFNGTIIVKL
jgi:hypothetical protein